MTWRSIFPLAALPLAAAAFIASAADSLPQAPGAYVTGDPIPNVASEKAGYNPGLDLEQALPRLLPDGWASKVTAAPRFARWDASATWVDALDQIALATNTHVLIDWTRRQVTVSEVSAAPAAMVAAAPSAPPAAPTVTMTAPELPPGAIAPAPSAPSAIAPEPVYPDLAAFLHEEVQVDMQGADLTQALGQLLPPGWMVDIRTDDQSVNSIRMDLTHVGPRGAALNAIGQREHLVLIPYVKFKKLIVSRQS